MDVNGSTDCTAVTSVHWVTISPPAWRFHFVYLGLWVRGRKDDNRGREESDALLIIITTWAQYNKWEGTALETLLVVAIFVKWSLIKANAEVYTSLPVSIFLLLLSEYGYLLFITSTKLKFQQKIDKRNSFNVPNLHKMYCVHRPQTDKHKIGKLYHVIHGGEKYVLFSFRE